MGRTAESYSAELTELRRVYELQHERLTGLVRVEKELNGTIRGQGEYIQRLEGAILDAIGGDCDGIEAIADELTVEVE